MPGFGRIAAADSKDRNYPMRAMIPKKISRISRYWGDSAWWGNQGNAPQCVGYAWTHWLEDGPVGHHDVEPPCIAPDQVYRQAQLVDEWQGEAYEGTSVRAGAKVLQSLGYIENYFWATTLQEVVDALLTVGPVVVGTNWYKGMLKTNNIHRVEPTGAVEGGHAYVLNGVNIKTGLIRIKNSWGRDWGNKGRALITLDHMNKLIQEDGEACLAVESVPK